MDEDGEGREGEEGEEGGGWDDDDVALPDLPDDVAVVGEGFVAPARGQPPSAHWPNNSKLVADHVAAGE